MQRILFVTDDHGVAGVVATIELDYVIDVLGEQVSRLALAFVAPLCANNHYRRHTSPSSRHRGCNRANAPYCLSLVARALEINVGCAGYLELLNPKRAQVF